MEIFIEIWIDLNRTTIQVDTIDNSVTCILKIRIGLRSILKYLST